MIRRRFRDWSIGRKLALLVLPASALGLLLALLLASWMSATTLRRNADQQTRSLAAVLAQNTAGALSFSDADNARRTLRSLEAVPGVVQACLYQLAGAEAPGGLLADYLTEGGGSCPTAPPVLFTDQPRGPRLRVLQPVRADGEEIGRLLIVRDLAESRRQISALASFSLVIFAMVLLLITVLLGLTLPRIVRPILALAEKMVTIRQTRDYDLRASKSAQDEVGSLVDSFNAMLDEIQRAQDQLVQSEKMAALASLVAGVAHEVNTPIGIGVTGISHLRQELLKVQAAWRDRTLGQQQLERFLQLCEESSQLVMTHLQRAADLVSSFKKVAVDQTADDCRDFELGAYLREVVLSLMPMFRNSGHELRLEATGLMPLHSYPGAIAQILTNLVMNALLHGLDGLSGGRVTVSARALGDEILLTVADNGRGIPTAHQASVFQPFFTTRRHAGGTGLGLHLVYNLTHQRLRGHIRFETSEGAGTEFQVRFPRITPNS